uniref:Uncharacterized protein n=1 Tax=Rhizophora mucronata TaxID=61149 RepID=A0A2P2P9W8_RHIMU
MLAPNATTEKRNLALLQLQQLMPIYCTNKLITYSILQKVSISLHSHKLPSVYSTMVQL